MITMIGVLAILLNAVAWVCLLIGMIRPKTFSFALGSQPGRSTIGFICLGTIMVTGIVASLSLPELKQVETISGQHVDKQAGETGGSAKTVSQQHWATIMTLSAGGEKKSAPFRLTGAEARLKYRFTGNRYSMMAVYVMETGERLMDIGGFPEVNLDGPGEGESYLYNSPGSYYLDVTVANGHVDLTVEELRDGPAPGK